MLRRCPNCSQTPLERRSVSGQVIDECAQCRGFWLDKADLVRLVRDPKTLIPWMATARHAAGRCSKKGHAVPPSRVSCPVCQAAPVGCPACQHRMSAMALGAWTVDICGRCEGIWLDAGKEAALGHLQIPPGQGASPTRSVPTPAGSLQGWEIPEATDLEGRDPYLAPGHQQALRQHPNAISGLLCHHCDVQVRARDAYAFEGDIYCVRCRPEGAVSGRQAESWLDRLMDREGPQSD